MKCLLFFTALITTATADLTCICSGPNTGPTCTNHTCTIPNGHCYSIQRQFAAEKDKPFLVGSKGCQEDKDPNVCNEEVVFILIENVFYLLSNVKCCNDKNECNKGVIVELPDVSKLNNTLSSKKLVCPSCFNLGKKTCDNAEQMNCREGQDKCFNISGTITRGSAPAQVFAAKGCAAQSAILKSGTNVTLGFDSYKLDNVEVVEAKSGVSQISSCLSFAILLPSVLWFLLDSSLH